jgi:small subunit ribosomal protein S21|tara:strand:- start:47 stop:253 length:207 start_codon:yes stop_codon:yes gene_type:complete
MIEVIVKNNNVEKAIRVLKKKMLKEGILKEIKRRQYYEKPSLKRQREHKENLKRCAKLKKQREKYGDY